MGVKNALLKSGQVVISAVFLANTSEVFLYDNSGKQDVRGCKLEDLAAVCRDMISTNEYAKTAKPLLIAVSAADQLPLLAATERVTCCQTLVMSSRLFKSLLRELDSPSDLLLSPDMTETYLSALQTFFYFGQTYGSSSTGNWRSLDSVDYVNYAVYERRQPVASHCAVAYLDFCLPYALSGFSDEAVFEERRRELLVSVFDPRDHSNPEHPDSSRGLLLSLGLRADDASAEPVYNAWFDHAITSEDDPDYGYYYQDKTLITLQNWAGLGGVGAQNAAQNLPVEFLAARPGDNFDWAWWRQGSRQFILTLQQYWLSRRQRVHYQGCELFVPSYAFSGRPRDIERWRNVAKT